MSQKNNDTIGKTVLVATALCLVCSVFVSFAAVYLKPLQTANRLLDKQRNIVQVAGVDLAGRSVTEAFEAFEARVVDLETGEFADHVDPLKYDQRKASKDPDQAERLPASEDIAGIKMRERYATVYLSRDANGAIEKIILPVRGYGLWSTLHGFLALKGDGNTVIGLSFFEHAETPGLGGEVDNPKWKSQWTGKKIYDPSGEVQAELSKGDTSDSPYKVDALAGATLTSNGVSNLIQYWMGENGFAPFLRTIAKG